MDKNRNGVLSMAELESIYNLMGVTNNETVCSILAQWDQGGKGSVSFQDFVKSDKSDRIDIYADF